MTAPVQTNAEYDIYRFTDDVGNAYGSSVGAIITLPNGELALYMYKSTDSTSTGYEHWSRKSKIVGLFSTDTGKTLSEEIDIHDPNDAYVQCPGGVAIIGGNVVIANAEDMAGDDEEGYGSRLMVLSSANGKTGWTPRIIRDFDAAEDFDGSETGVAYTEVDPNSRLALGKYRITAAAIGRDESAYVCYDYGASIVRGGIYGITMLIGSTSQVGARAYCGMSNTSDAANAWGTSDIKVWVEKTGVSDYTLNLGRNTTTQSVSISADTPYYCTIERKGIPGLDTVKLNIYTDAAKSVLLTTLTVTGFSTTAYRYVYAFATHNSGASGQAFNGYIENLQMNTYWMITGELKEIEAGLWAVPVHAWMSYNEHIGAATFIKPFRISMLYYYESTDTWTQPITVVESGTLSILEPSLEVIEQGVSAIMLIRSEGSYVLQSQGAKSGGTWSWSAPQSTGITAASSQVRVRKQGTDLHLTIGNRSTNKLERRVQPISIVWNNPGAWATANVFTLCNFLDLYEVTYPGRSEFIGYHMPYLPSGYTDPVIAFISGPYDLITQEVFVAVPKSAPPLMPVVSKPIAVVETLTTSISISSTITGIITGDVVAINCRDATNEAAQWRPLDDTLTKTGDIYTATEAITYSVPDKIVARAGVLRDTVWYYSEESAALIVREPPVPVNSGAISDSAIFGIQSFGGFGFGQLDGYPAEYEFAPIATDELLVYASNGAPVAVLDAATDVCFTRELFGLEELTFAICPTDAKYPEIRHLRRVFLDGRSYIIDRTGDERDESLSGKVVAVSLATHELGKIKNYGLAIETLTAAGGAASILLGSGWSVRSVSDTTKRRSYKPSAGETVLSNLLAWADICNLYPVFDSTTREIDLVASPGASNGVEIRVGKNARGIKREIDSGNVITRLYVYGKDDLSIAEANPTGLPYIDNFSHFIESEGVTEQAIYADIAANGKASRYLAEGEWRDNRYTDVTSLFVDAVVKLEDACRPKASYSAKVIDLARLVGSGYEHEAFALGDTLRLIDEELGIDTLQFVVREKRYPFEPERDEVELANKRLSVVDALTRAARVIEMVDRRGGAWEDSSDRVSANFDAWMRAHSLNDDGTIPIDLLRGIWYAANSAIRAGLNESVIIDNNGITIAEHTVVEDYNVNGSFGSVGFGEIAFGGYSGTVQLNWKTDRYIRMTGGAIVMCAGEGLPIRTAITPDGILAPALIIDNDNPLTPDGNAVIIDERGISIYHNNDPENTGYIRIGGGVIESWNFDDVAKTGFKISAATGAIIAHSLVLDGYIEVGDIIDTSDNAISSDGLTNYGGTRILINNAGFFAFKNGAYKIQLDAINDVYRFSGELFAGSINTLTDCNIGTDAYLGKNTGNLRSLWLNSAHSVRIHNSGSGANLSLAGTGTFTVAVDDFINIHGHNYFNANIDSDYGGILFGWQGIVGIYYNGVYAAQASVSFGVSFQTTPHVQATVTESGDVYGIGVAKFNAAVHSVTAAGCTVATRDILQVGLTGNVNVFVQAVQCKPI